MKLNESELDEFSVAVFHHDGTRSYMKRWVSRREALTIAMILAARVQSRRRGRRKRHDFELLGRAFLPTASGSSSTRRVTARLFRRYRERIRRRGNASAEYLLGLTADLWFRLAARSPYHDNSQIRATVEPHMTTAQLGEAKRLVELWRPRQLEELKAMTIPMPASAGAPAMLAN